MFDLSKNNYYALCKSDDLADCLSSGGKRNEMS